MEDKLLSLEEFKSKLEERKQKMIEDAKNGKLFFADYSSVSLFKSVRRAIRRGHMTIFGEVAPKRPFNNRANTSSRRGVHSRVLNEEKKRIYGQLKVAGI